MRSAAQWRHQAYQNIITRLHRSEDEALWLSVPGRARNRFLLLQVGCRGTLIPEVLRQKETPALCHLRVRPYPRLRGNLGGMFQSIRSGKPPRRCRGTFWSRGILPDLHLLVTCESLADGICKSSFATNSKCASRTLAFRNTGVFCSYTIEALLNHWPATALGVLRAAVL